MRLLVALMVGFVLLMPRGAGAAGFQSTTAPDPDGKPLTIAIWYPSDAPNAAGQFLAIDGRIEGKDLPLIVISHGNGANILAHADTALSLAEAGYVVVAIAHTGDTSTDRSSPPSRWIVDRPRHVARVSTTCSAAGYPGSI